MSQRSAAVVCTLLITATRVAVAEEPPACDENAGEYVAVDVTPADPLSALAPSVIDHLRAELSSRGLSVCPTNLVATPPVARLSLRSVNAVGDAVELEVHGTETPARVRMIDLATVPRNARPLALGIAAAELLTEHWRTPRLASPRATPPPAAPEIAVAARPVAEPPRARVKLAGAFGAQTFGGGYGHAGPELRLALTVGERGALHVRGAYLFARDIRAPNGNGEARTVAAGFGGTFALTSPARPWGVGLTADTHLLRVSALGRPESDARGLSGAELAWVADGGLYGWLHLWTRTRLELGLTGGGVLRSVTLTDDDQAVTALSGFAARATLGFAIDI